jgi:hypothetical protein
MYILRKKRQFSQQLNLHWGKTAKVNLKQIEGRKDSIKLEWKWIENREAIDIREIIEKINETKTWYFKGSKKKKKLTAP